jgi:GGDEF domain-containing protein
LWLIFLDTQPHSSYTSPQQKASFYHFTLSLENFDQFCEHLGHTRGQEVLTAFGTYINKHFGGVVGFSARQRKNQYATFFPYSNLQGAEPILKGFATDLQEEGLSTIQAEAHIPREMCFEFAIVAGFAEGRSGDEQLEVTFERAETRQKEIAGVRCEMRRERG